MALVIGTNSYVDVAEADLYFADRLYSDAWTASDAATKEQALLSSMLVLEPLCYWDSEKTDLDQALMWPRGGETEVPNNIKIAQMEIAIEALSQGIISFTVESDELKTLKAGSLTLAFYEKLDDPLTIVNSIAKSVLEPLGMCNFGSGMMQAKLYR